MNIVAEGIAIAEEDLRIKRGGLYALLCEGVGPLGAIDCAHRLVASLGYGPGKIVAEQFVYHRDLAQSVLGHELANLSSSGWSHDGIAVIIPGMSKSSLGMREDIDQADLASFLFALVKQLDGLSFPCIVPFGMAGLCVKEEELRYGLAVMGFTKVEVSLATQESAALPFLGEDALEEAVAMVSFPDVPDAALPSKEADGSSKGV